MYEPSGDDNTRAKIFGRPVKSWSEIQRWQRGNRRRETDSNTTSGRWITRERLATIGKVAANELEAQIMKREAMRRPLKAVSPPPEPQLRGGEDDMFGSSE